MKVANIEEQHKRKVITLLEGIKAFKFFNENDFEMLLDTAKLQHYDIREVIMSEGEYNNLVFFLISGSLSVFKNNKLLASLDHEGELFGEMGVLNQEPRSATIQADKSSLVLCIDATIMKDKGSKDEVMFNYILYRLFAEILSERLRKMINSNSKLMIENDELKQKCS